MAKTPKLTERQGWILKFLARNPGASTNRIYVNTSPACLAKGRKKSMGTYGWEGMAVLANMGLVRLVVDTSLRDELALKNPDERYPEYKYRWAVRYHWYLTTPGEVCASLIPATHSIGFFKGDSYVLMFE